jgi:hypothetical protein
MQRDRFRQILDRVLANTETERTSRGAISPRGVIGIFLRAAVRRSFPDRYAAPNHGDR